MGYPEVKEVLGHFFDKLLDESGRGAILIGTAHVEEHLTMLIENVLPSNKKTYKTRLLNYPGPISSFSAKIELSHAFRLIDSNLYNALNALRKVRNEAAHSSSHFILTEMAQQIKLIYSLGPGVPEMIKQQATEALVKAKAENIRQIFHKNEVKPDIQKKIIDDLLADKDKLEVLNSQVPHWELIYGLSLLCGLIAHEKSRLSLLPENYTWGSFLARNDDEEKNS